MVKGSKEQWAGGRARQGCRQSSREILHYLSNHNQKVKSVSNETNIFNYFLDLLFEECLDSLLYLKHLPLWFSCWRETFQKPPSISHTALPREIQGQAKSLQSAPKQPRKGAESPNMTLLSLLNTCPQHARQGNPAAKNSLKPGFKCLFTALAQGFLYISSNWLRLLILFFPIWKSGSVISLLFVLLILIKSPSQALFPSLRLIQTMSNFRTCSFLNFEASFSFSSQT